MGQETMSTIHLTQLVCPSQDAYSKVSSLLFPCGNFALYYPPPPTPSVSFEYTTFTRSSTYSPALDPACQKLASVPARDVLCILHDRTVDGVETHFPSMNMPTS